ncbi:SigE family RNA polymerase sigma factor [Dactylosporangium vinaceum]|uniref:SigE family RNA polymerase sigma factor n=1 Tax=Dactylosporangium vinaceum TaxID=53362 RepID=A0ABV5MEU8_9ACTN|nr:SigE family RNA polymerase sigma factor [Dactylosporangium vinaceum]UAB97089.1 SigE family RNA polymerase sigma factor [Dactylosporangium vinaceum]
MEETEFSAFVAERAHALLRTAYALTGDRHAAEDLVQSALAKAFARWRRIDEPEPYLRRMIYNDFVSAWRSPRRRREVSVAEPPERGSPAIVESDTALRLLLRDALQQLPPRQRAVLILRYFEDLTVEETAAVLSCRPGTVASQASRALTRLRELVPQVEWSVDLVERRS